MTISEAFGNCGVTDLLQLAGGDGDLHEVGGHAGRISPGRDSTVGLPAGAPVVCVIGNLFAIQEILKHRSQLTLG